MRKAAFKKFLMTKKSPVDRPYAASTAEERARCCGTIEKTFGIDLDEVAQNYKEKFRVLDLVGGMEKSNIPTFLHALSAYFEFADRNPYLPPKGKRPSLLPLQGPDAEVDTVRYTPDVLPEAQIPDLCMLLEREYGRIEDLALTVLGKVFGQRPPRIRVFLSPKRPEKKYRNGDDFVAKKISAFVKERGRITEDEVRGFLGYTDRIGGQFVLPTDRNGEEPYIVLYYRQFETADREEYDAMITQTLAHEYLHYLEYEYCTRFCRKPFRDPFVSEALADGFGVLSSLARSRGAGDFDRKVAERRYDLWVERFDSAWPYANALRFFSRVSRGGYLSLHPAGVEGICSAESVRKFTEVFSLTPNPRDASERLNET